MAGGDRRPLIENDILRMFLKGCYRKCAGILDVKTRRPTILTIKPVRTKTRPLTLLPFFRND